MLHAPRGTQHATNREKDATMNATTMQPTGLKALSARILSRNILRNMSATPPERACNNDPQKSTQNVHSVVSELHPIELVKSLPHLGDRTTAPPPVEITRAGIVYATPPRCYVCRSTDLWQSRYRVMTCRRCHPPAPGAEARTGIPGKNTQSYLWERCKNHDGLSTGPKIEEGKARVSLQET